MDEQANQYTKLSEQELFNIALNEQDENIVWSAIYELSNRATPSILACIHQLSQSPLANNRHVAADLLGQLARIESPLRQECTDLLLAMLTHELDPDTIASICTALGHWKDERAIEPALQRLHHPNDDVRFSVVFAISCHDDPRAIAGLIQLSSDRNNETRDWATFGLGSQIETDTPEIRDAPAARLNDPYPDVIDEAIVGLAQRHDPRAFEPLLKNLEEGYYGSLLFEAATHLADPRLLPTLIAQRDTWNHPPEKNWLYEGLLEAIEACSGNQQTPH
jgi:HEAT repeat protein